MHLDLKYWYLHEHQLFENLTPAEIDALCMLKRFKKTKRSEIMSLPASEKERVYFLKKGTLKLIRINDQGNEILLDIIQQGNLFGELSLSKSNDSNKEYIRVVSDEAILCTFYKEKIENLMLQKPNFAIKYVKHVGDNYNNIKNSYKNLFFKSSKTRLLLFIDSLINDENDNFIVPKFITQKDIAQLICTTRQTVISLLKQLEDEGIISHTNHQISIPNLKNFKKYLENVK